MAGEMQTFEKFKNPDPEVIKKEAIKEFLEKHTIIQVEARNFFKDEKRARKFAEKLEKIGFTVVISRRLY
jgi:hypothetical protein